jgi:hypothetical protein
MKRSKRTILPIAALAGLALAAAPANAATILASWDVFTDTTLAVDADFTATGITASISDIDGVIRRFQSTNGNTDGTYGSTLAGASMTVGRMHIFQSDSGNGALAINITNSTGAPLTLDELLFDLEVKERREDQSNPGAKTHDTYEIVFENTTQSTTSAVLGAATLPTGWNDVDIDASSITLAAGDVGFFEITLSQGDSPTSGTSSGTLDNFAITGTVVPEPTSALLALAGVFGVLLRRKRRG